LRYYPNVLIAKGIDPNAFKKITNHKVYIMEDFPACVRAAFFPPPSSSKGYPERDEDGDREHFVTPKMLLNGGENVLEWSGEA